MIPLNVSIEWKCLLIGCKRAINYLLVYWQIWYVLMNGRMSYDCTYYVSCIKLLWIFGAYCSTKVVQNNPHHCSVWGTILWGSTSSSSSWLTGVRLESDMTVQLKKRWANRDRVCQSLNNGGLMMVCCNQYDGLLIWYTKCMWCFWLTPPWPSPVNLLKKNSKLFYAWEHLN